MKYSDEQRIKKIYENANRIAERILGEQTVEKSI